MYLTADRLALANQAVLETFENTCISWQAIPHWDTGDPGQTRVPDDDVNASVPFVIPFVASSEDLDVTLAMTLSANSDSLLNKVIDKTVDLARGVDDAVIAALHAASNTKPTLNTSSSQLLQDSLIDARAEVEKAGFRAPSCLITNTKGVKKLSELTTGGYSVLEPLLTAGNVNSLHRAEVLGAAVNGQDAAGVFLGRRQRIPHGGAADASPGEEPVDIAVSVPPSLESVGENGANTIALTIRIKYALRVKDSHGIVGFLD